MIKIYYMVANKTNSIIIQDFYFYKYTFLENIRRVYTLPTFTFEFTKSYEMKNVLL